MGYFSCRKSLGGKLAGLHPGFSQVMALPCRSVLMPIWGERLAIAVDFPGAEEFPAQDDADNSPWLGSCAAAH
jgi:hypothetical protein